jgi:hypothetical protein
MATGTEMVFSWKLFCEGSSTEMLTSCAYRFKVNACVLGCAELLSAQANMEEIYDSVQFTGNTRDDFICLEDYRQRRVPLHSFT